MTATAAFDLRGWLGDALRVLTGGVARGGSHPFDRRHGVDTDGLLYAPDLSSEHPHAALSAGYYATAPSLFAGAMELWRSTLAETGFGERDYAFVDIGCGKGRVVMMATGYGFREVVGVELNPMLADTARRNLRLWRTRGPLGGLFWRVLAGLKRRAPGGVRDRIRIVEGDALNLRLPDGPVVLFFFNSFERKMAEMWLARLGRLAAGRRWPLDLVYVHPEFDALVCGVPGVRVLRYEEIQFSVEDGAADAFGVNVDRCGVYRWGG